MEKDPHVSLLLTEADDGRTDPQTLARLSIQGMTELIAHQDPGFPRIKDLYLKRFPDSERLFGFGDFNVWRITPISGRLVAGFGRAFNIAPETLQKASML
jgi:putative heme iron utilization protein